LVQDSQTPLEYQTPVRVVASDLPLWQQALMLLFVWAPLGLVFVAIVGVVMGMSCSYMVGQVGMPIGVLFCAYAIYRMQRARRRRRAMAILSYVETATRLNLSLNEYLLAAELSERGATRERLSDLRRRFMSGASISTALYEAVPEMPASIIATARVGESLGQVQPTLRRLVNEVARPTLPPNERMPFYWFYGIGLCVAVFNLAAWLMVYIMPKFKEIFRDFSSRGTGVTLPPATANLIVFYDRMGDMGVVFLVIEAVVFLGLVGWLLERAFTLRRESQRRLALIDKMLWNLPVLGRLNRARSMSDICNVLAESTRAGIPLPQALERAEDLNINNEAKRQVKLWQQGVTSGQSPAKAAQAAKMPELLVGLINPAQSQSGHDDQSRDREGATGAMEETLKRELRGRSLTVAAQNLHAVTNVFEFLARYYRGQFSRLMITLQAASEPLLVIALGIMVAWMTMTVISPVAALVQAIIKVYWGGDVL